MKKSDIIRGLKSELKSLEDAKSVRNIDYHRGKMDQLRSLIKDFNSPTGCEKFKGLINRLPSRELRIIK